MIQKGKKVKIHYELHVEGNVVDSSEDKGPLEYEHGVGQIIPGLERALEGLKSGDKKEVHIGPDDAYGAIDPKAILEVPKKNIAEKDIQVGMVLSAKSPDGSTLQGTIQEIKEDKVVVNFNHPLAGKELFFKVEIIEIF